MKYRIRVKVSASHTFEFDSPHGEFTPEFDDALADRLDFIHEEVDEFNVEVRELDLIEENITEAKS